MIKNFSDPKLKKLVMDICNEHWKIAEPNDGNIGYLWYMYAAGIKVGTFRPFMFLSELNLLVKLGYITDIEKDNMFGMLNSLDEDNVNIMAYSLLTLRNNRIKDIGIWTSDNNNYKKIDYIKDVIHTNVFMNMINNKKWEK